MKKITFLLVLVFLYSCNNGNNVDSTESQTTETETVFDKYKYYTEEDLYKKASAAISNFKEREALEILEYLKNKNPAYQKEMVDYFIESTKKIIKEKEELAKKGFTAIKENKTVKYGGLKYNFSNISINKILITDRYDDTYHYFEAERNNKYISINFSISSETKDPNLYPIYIYKESSYKLKLIRQCFYRFNRWQDYGTYLGNYTDKRNSFAYSETIHFVAGYEISEFELNNNNIYIVLKKEHSVKREEDRFANPPIRYVYSGYDVKETLLTDDFVNDYVLIKVFKNQIK